MDIFLQQYMSVDAAANADTNIIRDTVMPLFQKELKQRTKSKATTFKTRYRPKTVLRTTSKNHSYYTDAETNDPLT